MVLKILVLIYGFSLYLNLKRLYKFTEPKLPQSVLCFYHFLCYFTLYEYQVTGKRSVFFIIWRNYVICLKFLGRKHCESNYQNFFHGDSMETAWRVTHFLKWRFYGKISLEIIWGFSWRKHGKSIYQTISTLILP